MSHPSSLLNTPNPSVSQHLADRSLTPILTSARSQGQLEALTTLTNTALTCYSTAAHLNLGTPQRLMVEHARDGPVVLNSFMAPPTPKPVPVLHADSDQASQTNTTRSRASRGPAQGDPDSADTDVELRDPPMLVTVVVGATTEDGPEARKAAARLEQIGHAFHREWEAENNGEAEDGFD